MPRCFLPCRLLLLIVSLLSASASHAGGMSTPPVLQQVASRGSCKAVSSCEEAVALWCGGYRRADADDDGIPCENICRSLAEVQELQQKIGC